MFNFLTIKTRIFLTFAILSSLAIYYFSNWVSESARRHYLESAEELLVDQLIMVKKFIIQNTPKGSSLPDIEFIKKVYSDHSNRHPKAVIYDVSKDSTDIECYVTDKEGTVLFHSQNDAYIGQSFLKWRNIFLALGNNYGARSTRDVKDDPTTSNLHVTHPLILEGELIGTLTLIKPVKRISFYLELSRNRVTRIAAFTLILILLLGFLLMRRIVKPIEDLTKYTEKISQGERPQLPNLPKGEMALLGKTIEVMTTSLDGKSYIESYIQGLTHELKSPIAAIKGAAELIEADKLSKDELKLLNNINLESDRMAEMVQKLLLLSRIENQSFSKNQEIIDLQKLLQEVLDEARERYPQREFNLNLESSGEVKGDSLLIKTAINNLLANACDFSNRAIEIDLKGAARLSILVKDQGVGIPNFAKEKIFERFYSLPRPGTGSKSSGLGLSIVQEIMNLHQGQVQVSEHSKGDSGTVVTLEFPQYLRQ